jgi:hypothetical protein
VEPRMEEWTRTAMMSHPTSPPAAGLPPRTILSQRMMTLDLSMAAAHCTSTPIPPPPPQPVTSGQPWLE